jgi:hypothetical protein
VWAPRGLLLAAVLHTHTVTANSGATTVTITLAG